MTEQEIKENIVTTADWWNWMTGEYIFHDPDFDEPPEGDGTTFTVYDFKKGTKASWTFDPAASNYKDNGHAGGDLALVRDFLEAVDTRDFSKLSSSLDASVDSHVMGFACERSRNR